MDEDHPPYLVSGRDAFRTLDTVVCKEDTVEHFFFQIPLYLSFPLPRFGVQFSVFFRTSIAHMGEHPHRRRGVSFSPLKGGVGFWGGRVRVTL